MAELRNIKETTENRSNVSESFWESSKDVIKATEKHEFLINFADCLNILSRNPEISKEDKNRLEKFAIDAREAEMSLHNGFFQRWEVDAEDAKAMPHTVLYCSNMLRVVSTRCYAEGLAALLPCFWIYMHVGKVMLKLRDELGDSVQRCDQYNEWIDMYASDEFESDVKDYINMVNEVAVDASDSTILKMREHFSMSCHLEYMFWDQGLNLMKWPSFPTANCADEEDVVCK